MSGRLSNQNTHSEPSFLSTCVRINKNKAVVNPPWKKVLKAYKSKYGKVENEEDVSSYNCSNNAGSDTSGNSSADEDN